jgi:hypothetical protein
MLGCHPTWRVRRACFLSDFVITNPESLDAVQVVDCDMKWQLRVATLAARQQRVRGRF